MFIIRTYTVNSYSGERNDEVLDNYYLVGTKNGFLNSFYIGRSYTVRDTLSLMRKLGYRPAHSGDLAKWAKGYLRYYRELEEENYQVYLDSFPDGDRAHWSCDITHLSIEYITELDIKPSQIYLYI